MKLFACALVLLAALGCSSSNSSTGSGGANDFTCGTSPAPATVAIADATTPAQFTQLKGTEIPSGRWVLTSVVAQSPLAVEQKSWIGRKIGLAIEVADGSKFTAVTVDSNGATARFNGTFAIQGSSVDFTAACEPSNTPDGTAPDIGVTNYQFEVDGTSMTMTGYVTENTTTSNASSLTAVPMQMTLTRE